MDVSLALLCGLLLAIRWLRATPLPRLSARSLRTPAVVLFVALIAQLLLTCMTMCSSMTPSVVMAAMPDVLTTHAGRIAEYLVVVALVFAVWTLLPLRPTVSLAGSTAFLALAILLRSATGHAAVDGDWSLAELLQAVHLSAMALWSGGVLLSGFAVSRLCEDRPHILRPYIASLSTTSTWAVAAVALSGVVKAWRQIGGDLHLLRGSGWAWLLYAKVACVTLAIALGGLNRLGLMRSDDWQQDARRRAAKLLRVEAWVMLAVLVLSAWLANMPPPGE